MAGEEETIMLRVVLDRNMNWGGLGSWSRLRRDSGLRFGLKGSLTKVVVT